MGEWRQILVSGSELGQERTENASSANTQAWIKDLESGNREPFVVLLMMRLMRSEILVVWRANAIISR